MQIKTTEFKPQLLYKCSLKKLKQKDGRTNLPIYKAGMSSSVVINSTSCIMVKAYHQLLNHIKGLNNGWTYFWYSIHDNDDDVDNNVDKYRPVLANKHISVETSSAVSCHHWEGVLIVSSTWYHRKVGKAVSHILPAKHWRIVLINVVNELYIKSWKVLAGMMVLI